MTFWYSSDLHLNHKNILRYSKRPFKDVMEMNEALVNNWNSRVKQDDIAYILGDLGFGNVVKYLKRMNGIKHLVAGNHDDDLLDDPEFRAQFKSIDKVIECTINNQFIVMSHYAHRVWRKSHRGAWMLYGHSHSSLPDDPNALSIDVGVDCHNYAPISFKEIQVIMSRKNYKPVDHHGRKDQ